MTQIDIKSEKTEKLYQFYHQQRKFLETLHVQAEQALKSIQVIDAELLLRSEKEAEQIQIEPIKAKSVDR